MEDKTKLEIDFEARIRFNGKLGSYLFKLKIARIYNEIPKVKDNEEL